MPYTYNEQKLTNLGHLKVALQRAQSEVGSLAALVVGTIEDMILQETITIATSAWAANSDATTSAEGYAYKADVSVTGLIENANVDITLTIPSQKVAAAAGLSATVETAAGRVRFFAKKIPTAALTGKLDAIQLDDQDES